jgi:hypothetical protein
MVNDPRVHENHGRRNISTGSGFTYGSSRLRWKPRWRITSAKWNTCRNESRSWNRPVDEAVKQAPPEIRAVAEALHALLGVAQTTAATVVRELGSL